MAQKHIAYYRLLEALEAPGCPICRLAEESVRRRMQFILYESVNDPAVRKELTASRGFCPRHGELFLELGSPLGAALIYSDIIDAVSQDLLRSPSRKRRLTEKPACPACGWAENSAQQSLCVLADNMNDEEMRVRIASNRDFCIPHLFRLLSLASSDELDHLRNMALRHLADLKSELSEIVRKSDYRCSEPWGPEGDSWRRAVRKLSGQAP